MSQAAREYKPKVAGFSSDGQIVLPPGTAVGKNPAPPKSYSRISPDFGCISLFA
jgi:hypothetical protein